MYAIDKDGRVVDIVPHFKTKGPGEQPHWVRFPERLGRKTNKTWGDWAMTILCDVIGRGCVKETLGHCGDVYKADSTDKLYHVEVRQHTPPLNEDEMDGFPYPKMAKVNVYFHPQKDIYKHSMTCYYALVKSGALWVKNADYAEKLEMARDPERRAMLREAKALLAAAEHRFEARIAEARAD